jgi:hypothetical protein
VAITTTNPLPTLGSMEKDIMSIMASHNVPYAATLNVYLMIHEEGGSSDLKGLGSCTFSSLSDGWRYRAEYTVGSRLAVRANVFPLFRSDGIHFCHQ